MGDSFVQQLRLLLLREIGETNRERRDLGHHLQPALTRELAQAQVQSAALAPEVMPSATLAKETDLAPAQVRQHASSSPAHGISVPSALASDKSEGGIDVT